MGATAESGMHALFSCGLGQSIWAEYGGEIAVPRGCSTIADWWSYVFKDMSTEEVEKFLAVCWAIWTVRCKATMEAEYVAPASTCTYAMRIWREVKEAKSCTARADSRMEVPYATKWSKPEPGWVKRNVDVGVIGTMGVGVGVVCRDAEGEVLACVVVQRRVS